MAQDEHEPTDEQRAIFEFVRGNNGNLVVEALAGSGKSYCAIQALKVIPQRSVLMVAFNRPVADNLQAKIRGCVPKTHAVHVKTFHQLGLGIIRANHPQLEVKKDATEDVVGLVCKTYGTSFKVKRCVFKLIRLLKETTIKPTLEADDVITLAHEHEIFGSKMTEGDIETVIDRAMAGYEASRDIANIQAIDFCDMTWLPTVLNLPPSSRYQAIIIDELQDISEPQFELLQHVMLPTTRVIAIGDLRQAVYGWRGGMGARAWGIMRDNFKAKTLRLTTTFRCGTAVVKQANRVLEMNANPEDAENPPVLQAMADAPEGSVASIKLAGLASQFVGGPSDVVHTFVLSRRNDMLLDCALFLHRSKTKFQLIGGKDLLAPLFDLLDYKLDLGSKERFRASLVKWHAEQKAKAEKIGSITLADRIDEQRAMLISACEAAESPTRIKSLLHAILADNQSGVWLSTVHKVKGLEARRVFLLRQSFARHFQHNESIGVKWAPGPHHEWTPQIPQEELNIEYVAITRAREHLVWVDMNKHDAEIDVEEAELALADLIVTDKMLQLCEIGDLEHMFERAEREALRLDKHDPEAAKKWTLYAGRVLTVLTAKVQVAKHGK